MNVLTIVDPGCAARSQQELRERAETLLRAEFRYEGGKSTAWGTDHHHVGGRVQGRDQFDRLRSHGAEDDRPTRRPLRRCEGDTVCVGCDGTGRMLFAAADNHCPLCGGTGKLVGELDPYVFPIWLFDPGYRLFAVVTPDSRWTDDRTPAGWLAVDWDRHVLTVCESYRHCYGVVNWVKT